ncbi:uroporphyrinogen-III synthase [Maricaulis sp.]|uniref:uroporphyrinogen-III synthase n=1 Tax=Maricaulis sp. TaxID=1486257 RepID=UPI003A92C443
MTVLVTRGWPGAKRTATELRARGIDPIIAPVLDINFRARIEVDLTEVQALIFTSGNGVRAWGPRRPERDLPVYTVGDSTAADARKAGFRKVVSANGDVHDLAALIKRKVKPQNGSLVHVRGIHVAGDLAGELKADGYQVRDVIGYGAVAVDALREDAIAAILCGAPVAVLIHSARGAKTFLDLVRKFGLQAWLKSVTAYGISANALKPLENAGFAALVAAAHPSEDALLDLLVHPMELAPLGDAS